ncbi:MAG TPA: phosphatase PAP2 family protein [Planctomycetota bacterium]|nr:phosphatase PAP2 family protein [Planctomycetota bacterium]
MPLAVSWLLFFVCAPQDGLLPDRFPDGWQDEIDALRLYPQVAGESSRRPSIEPRQDPPPTPPQQEPTDGIGQVFVRLLERGWNLIETLGRDTLYLAASPLRLTNETVWPVIGVVGLVVASAVFDESVQRWTQEHRTKSRDDFFDKIEPMGNDYTIELTAFGLGLLSGESWVVEMALTAFEARILANGLVEGIKKFAGRSRPHQSRDAFQFELFGDDDSFPTGHVINVAPTIFVFSRYLDSWVFDILGAAFLALKSAQRIESDSHWLSDTVGSIVIGWAVGNAMVDLRENPDLRILPYVGEDPDGGNLLGLGLEFRY